MVKINKEEYKYLKNLDDKWKWIARNRDGGVYTFQEPPEKVDNFRWNNMKHPWLGVYGNRFSFIQWEDENPYNIAELIAEYEWATALRSVLYDESEEAEPEVLSQAWIDQNHFETENLLEDLYKSDGETIDYTPHIKVIAVQDLQKQNLIEPKQELPTIPKFVAEFLIGKEDYMLYELLDDEWLYKEHDRVAKWLYDNDELTNRQREIDLVMARDRGYTIEKEQLYFAKIKGHENINSDDKYWNYCITDESLDIGDNKVHADVLAEYVLNATKDEWENLGINDDNADFVEVEELE